MSQENGQSIDELVELLLDDYQRSLHGDHSGETSIQSVHSLPPEAEERVRKGKACLAALHELGKDRSATNRQSRQTPTRSLPRMIGRFEIRSELGIGGFGIVYKAYDPLTHREVAIKIPRLEVLTSEPMLRRFELEAAAAGQLDHPNIVTVHEAGDEGPMPYLVMSYYSGPTLAAWLNGRSTPPSPVWSADVVRQLALAVEYAHGRGILHRDIKPSNVLLTGLEPSDGDSLSPCIPKLMDFGLAKIAELGGDMTKTGAILGTVKYMAPEQATGKKGETTTACDIYSLGVILYQLLTGHVPFDGPTEVDTLRQIASDDPPSIPRGKTSKERDVAAICMRCLEKKPNHRYASAGGLAEDLRRALVGEIVSAKETAPLERAIKWTRKHPLWAALVMVIAVFASALVAGSLWYNQRLTQLLDVADRDRQRAQAGELKARKQAYITDMRDLLERFNTSKRDQVESVLNRYVPKPGEPDVRGFEWRLVDKYLRTDSSYKRLFIHQGGVTAVAIHPKETIAASAGGDGVIRLWKLPGGESAGTLSGHLKGEIDALTFSPDGTLLASGSEDTSVRLWNMSTQQEHALLKGHTDWVSSLSFSPDGNTLASGSGDRRIVLWNVAEKRLLREIIGHTDNVRSVIFDPTRPILYSSSEDMTVRVWDTETGQPSKRVEDGQFRVTNDRWLKQIIIGRYGHELLGADLSEEVQRWCIEDNDFGKRNNLRNVSNHVRSIRLAELPYCGKDRNVLVRGSEEGPVSIMGFSTLSGIDPKFLIGHSAQVDAMAVTRNARFVLSGDSLGELLLWNLDPPWPMIVRNRDFDLPVRRICMTYDGESVLFSDDQEVYRQPFDGSSPPVAQWTHEFGSEIVVEVSRQSDLLVEHKYKDKTYSVHHFARPNDVFREVLSEDIQAVAIAPDSRRVAIAHGQTLSILDVARSTIIHRHPVISAIHSMQFIHDVFIVAACEDGTVRRISTDDGRVMQTIACDPQPLGAVRISLDRKTLAVGGTNFVSILDATTGQLRARLPHQESVHTLVFLDNGRRLLTNDASPRNRLWDLESFQCVGTLEHFECGNSIWASADGLRLCCLYAGRLILVDARPE
ncbi:protein kinase [bacterium]|nr:protein kinase [bacterium]